MLHCVMSHLVISRLVKLHLVRFQLVNPHFLKSHLVMLPLALSHLVKSALSSITLVRSQLVMSHFVRYGLVKSNLVGSQGTPCQVTSQLAKLDLCKVPVFQVELCNVPTCYVTLYKVPACHVILKVPGCHVTPYLLKPQLARFDPCSPQLPTYCFFPYRYHCHLESSWSLSSNPRKAATKLLPKTRWSTPNQNLRNGPNSATTWRSCRNRKSQNRSACRKRRRGNRGKARHSWNGFKRRKMVKKVEVSPPGALFATLPYEWAHVS